ncbi:hypothetical protein [Hymenobacter convexus]|uniref:hypothetical protein n=1 Tax=Hymenobacter sp. CA1UV-4 TaxID=3063782 RepID=UPI002729AEDA|nr:hypothetical protein [Hymenobacter sp. CA1UV-4]
MPLTPDAVQCRMAEVGYLRGKGHQPVFQFKRIEGFQAAPTLLSLKLAICAADRYRGRYFSPPESNKARSN